MTRSSQLLLVLVAALLWLVATDADAWVAAPDLGYGRGIVVTPSGDLLTCGQSLGPNSYDFTVRLQRAADGSDLWTYRLDGSDPGFYYTYDSAGEVALDDAGNILAVGSTTNVGSGDDVQVVKLSPDGTPLWTRRIDSAIHANDAFADMAVGPGGDVAVTGTFAIAEGVGLSFSIVRIAGTTGEPLWQHDVTAPLWSSGVTVGFDSAGNVLASGDFGRSDEFLTPNNTRDIVAVKLDGATGDEIWRTILSGGAAPFDDDEAQAAVIDAAGDFYVGGKVDTTSGDGFTVFKLSGSDGSVLWRYDHASRDYGRTLVLALDGAGHVYAAGEVTGVFVHDRFDLEKLSVETGVPVWSRRMQNLFFTSLAFDPAGDLILGGTNRGGLFTIRKVSAADGRKRWHRQLPGNLYNGGYVLGVVADAAGDVYAIGGDVAGLPKPALDNGPYSYTVVKACGRDGRTRRTDRCR